MTTAKKMIQVASSYIGVSGTDNVFNTWYWGYHCYDGDVYPWCAVFQSYVAMEAGLKCKYSASAAGFANQFERVPVSDEANVKPGDIVVFNWDGRNDIGWCDHVGLVEWSTIGQDGKFGTIEGNTGNAAGGEVKRVTRDNDSYYFTAFFRPKYESAAGTTTSSAQATAKPSNAKKLYGIDVSSNQPEDICALVKNEFAFVKMSGNPQGYAWDYVNPYAKKQAQDAGKKHGRVAFYHFTWGKDACTEADFFIAKVKALGYLGKAVLAIDYEADAVELGRAWVKKFADRIKAKTGIAPVIYASGSVIVAQKLMELGYPIWCANYYKGYERIDGYDTSGCKIYGGCEDSVLWQYTSQGFLSGYSGALDCNVFFGGDAEWKKLAGIASGTAEAEPAPREPTSGSSASTKKKSVATVAKEVIKGKWGNGADRKKKLEKAGYDYAKVQAKVNELLGVSKKSVDELAREVIRGEWGNGSDRRKRLEAAGYDYDAVQARVNEII